MIRQVRRLPLPLLLAVTLLALLMAVAGVPGASAAPPAAPAVTSAWHSTTPFNQGRTSAGSALIGNRLYVVGGYSYDSVAAQLNLYNDVQSAVVSRHGGIVGTWHSTTPFNIPRLGAGIVAYKHRLYVIGGGDGGIGYYSDVQYASVDRSGDVASGGWNTSPNRLVIPRSSFSAGTYSVNDKTYLYVVGGVGNDASGNTVHYDNVEYAQIKSDGSVGPWALMANTFNKPRSGLSSAFVNGCLYIVGGFGDALTDIFADVQYSCLTPSGTLSPWVTSPNSLHVARYSPALFVVPRPGTRAVEFIVAGGNAGGGTYLSEVEHSVVRGRSGNSPWTVSNASADLPQAEWGQTGQLYAGKAYVLGGVTRSQDYLNDVVWARVPALQ